MFAKTSIHGSAVIEILVVIALLCVAGCGDECKTSSDCGKNQLCIDGNCKKELIEPPDTDQQCGNGRVESQEVCEPSPIDGTMPCPSEVEDCDDSDDCTADSLSGEAGKCSAKCGYAFRTPGFACVGDQPEPDDVCGKWACDGKGGCVESRFPGAKCDKASGGPGGDNSDCASWLCGDVGDCLKVNAKNGGSCPNDRKGPDDSCGVWRCDGKGECAESFKSGAPCDASSGGPGQEEAECGDWLCDSKGGCDFDWSDYPSGTLCNADSDGCTADDECDGKGGCEPGSAVVCKPADCRYRTCSSTGVNTHDCLKTVLIEACNSGDGCCPASCDENSDSDCPHVECGDGVKGTAPQIADGFETGDLGGLPWQVFGWEATDLMAHGRDYSLEASGDSPGRVSLAAVDVYTDGEVCFWYRASVTVSSPYNVFRFYVDAAPGLEVVLDSGDILWTSKCVQVPKGTHGFTWVFEKGGGADLYIDDVKFTQGVYAEDCDDGGNLPGDGCSSYCTVEACGDGIDESRTNTGWRSPRSYENDTDIIAPEGILDLGGGAADMTASTSDVVVYDFDLVVPEGARIDGIEAMLLAKGADSNPSHELNLKLRYDGRASASEARNSGQYEESDYIYRLVGGVGDKWGRAWSSDDMSNGNFGVEIGGPSSGMYVDNLRVRVWFTPAPKGCDDGDTEGQDGCSSECEAEYCGNGESGESVPAAVDDFESGNLNRFPYVWRWSPAKEGAVFPFEISDEYARSGVFSMRSANADCDSSTAEVGLFAYTDGEVGFWYLGSSENENDVFRFYIDGAVQLEVDSDVDSDWNSYVNSGVSPGVHEFRWSYQKDGSGSSGQDRWYVDDVSFSSSYVEECDDGDTDDSDECSNSCRFNSKGF